MAQETEKLNQESLPQPTTWFGRVRSVLHGPVLVGVIAALIAIGLSVFGMVRNPEATPLNLRSLALVIVLAGGSWGLIAWAIATAAVEAGKD
jgi:hypothetical protein